MHLTENSKIVRFFSTIIKPRAQIFNLIIISVIAALIAIVPYTQYNGIETEVPLVPITTPKIKEWGALPTRVTTGLYINNFPTLDFVNNDFVFDGILWFEFDPALISLNTVSKFAFEKGEITYISEPYTQLSNNNFFARYNLRVRFKSDMNYKLFPFDDHRIDIVLINRAIEPSEMIFWSFSPYFEIAPTAGFSGWHLYDTLVNIGISESVIERTGTQKIIAQPRVVFSICLKREGTRNILLILLPLFIIYFISLFSFSFDPIKNPGTIFSLASAGVTGLLSYRFVIEGMTPKVGYFVLSDKIFILFLLATLCEFALAVLLMQLKKMTPLISLLRGITYVLLNTIFIIAWYYFLIRS
jgi:hypothetical protein